MMGKFRKKDKPSVGALNTASLPDIVFMLLFFFMVTTQMREVELMIKYKLPKATDVKKLEDKSLVSFVYIGKPAPAMQKLYGTEPRIQLNDAFQSIEDIQNFIAAEREKLSESDQKAMTVSLKVDEFTKMGIISDVKQALRKSNALKINYSTLKVKDNLATN